LKSSVNNKASAVNVVVKLVIIGLAPGANPAYNFGIFQSATPAL
jgi:hypothetical protein